MNVNINITTVDQTFPTGTVAGNIRYQILSGGVPVATQETAELSVIFASVDVGAYTATAQRMDDSGNLLGTAVSSTFDVGGTPTTIAVPNTMTVTLS